MQSFLQLKKNFKNDFSGFQKYKIAVLGDCSTQLLVQAIRGMGYEHKLDLQIWEADFNQIDRQVFELSSDLYTFKPEIVIIFKSSHKLLLSYNKIPTNQQVSFSTSQMESIEQINNALKSNLNAKVIFYNFNEIDDSVFGNYSNKTETSFVFQLRKLNYELMCFAEKTSNFYISDISSIQNEIGRKEFFRTSMYYNSEMVISLDVLPKVASKTVEIVKALNGKIKKCIILDLDNTLWGGIIGDDGIENIQIGNLGIGKAFTEFQYWIKKLKNRGILVAVCSKNTESVAKEPFIKHPDMVLRLEDIAVFVANWENKVNNIRHIQQVLNIGFDSMVFIDDNPFERNMVRENIQDLYIPEMPEDPADYLEFLYTLNIFETASFSMEDTERTQLYQNEAQRVIVQHKFDNEDDYLKSLEMFSLVDVFNEFNTPRVAQLSQRSNQFNLRTIRYSQADLEDLVGKKEYFTFAFGLEDKFGDNGLICCVILHHQNQQTLFIDSWFMSCRVLKRGMENFVLNAIVSLAKEMDVVKLKGEYIPTSKNEIVKDHYLNFGFEAKDGFWELDISNYKIKKTFIKIKNQQNGKK